MTRRGCHLCDDAERLLTDLGVDCELRDVDADAELLQLYDWRVPVLLAGDEVVLEGRFDAAAIKRRGLAAPRPG